MIKKLLAITCDNAGCHEKAFLELVPCATMENGIPVYDYDIPQGWLAEKYSTTAYGSLWACLCPRCHMEYKKIKGFCNSPRQKEKV